VGNLMLVEAVVVVIIIWTNIPVVAHQAVKAA
jgi:hypothetical protein